MTDQVSLKKNITAPVDSEFISRQPEKAMCQYKLVPYGSTGLSQHLVEREFEHYLGRSVTVEFHNAQGFTVWSNKAPVPDCDPSATSENPFSSVLYHNNMLDESIHTTRRQFSNMHWYSLLQGSLSEFNNEHEFVSFDDTDDLTSANGSLLYFSEPRIPAWLEAELDSLFLAAGEEQFEAGMESQFTRGLQQLSEYNPNLVLKSLKARLESDKGNSGAIAKTLEWVSHQENPSLFNDIVGVLLIGLKHASPLVRDTAALGLAYFDEGKAIGYLKQAIEKEDVPELREDLEDLLQSLEM